MHRCILPSSVTNILSITFGVCSKLYGFCIIIEKLSYILYTSVYTHVHALYMHFVSKNPVQTSIKFYYMLNFTVNGA